jgi:hypothetical protein
LTQRFERRAITFFGGQSDALLNHNSRFYQRTKVEMGVMATIAPSVLEPA